MNAVVLGLLFSASSVHGRRSRANSLLADDTYATSEVLDGARPISRKTLATYLLTSHQATTSRSNLAPTRTRRVLNRLRGGQMPQGMMPGAGGPPQQGPAITSPFAGSNLVFNIIALFLIYISNNWLVVEALLKVFSVFLAPFRAARDQQQEQRQKAERVSAAEQARKARLERLKMLNSELDAEDEPY
mmetsp:Transcript_33989/g.54260  ORF Transcript_33989/g.54260 Transcript_33989/m.54260 type:complete len:188 (-) Transcript_33989:102-665(-)|eukprot:CAMPEP_0169248350 /NCGR_PEP_ID=MMETSP1016-20121227/35801_1 /TAXON_ID=342587 /ORGANISM="Karlodinium micrum, Strain CCMP2283" /LENGTH=187 /DNA_ID=CAMNT_0009329151 /DNA_START=49 /DNA_END=612 /DNA_ORIENTATION=+